jgi:hypothetical protein
VVSSSPLKNHTGAEGSGGGISNEKVNLINGEINLMKESIRTSNIRIEAL